MTANKKLLPIYNYPSLSVAQGDSLLNFPNVSLFLGAHGAVKVR